MLCRHRYIGYRLRRVASITRRRTLTDRGWVTLICVSKRDHDWVREMALYLFDAKPLFELMLSNCQSDHSEQTSPKFQWEHLANGGHFDSTWRALHSISGFENLIHGHPSAGGRNFADYIFECIFFQWNIFFFIQLSLKFVIKGLFDMEWNRV